MSEIGSWDGWIFVENICLFLAEQPGLLSIKTTISTYSFISATWVFFFFLERDTCCYKKTLSHTHKHKRVYRGVDLKLRIVKVKTTDFTDTTAIKRQTGSRLWKTLSTILWSFCHLSWLSKTQRQNRYLFNLSAITNPTASCLSDV